jgi:hypothetical protein
MTVFHTNSSLVSRLYFRCFCLFLGLLNQVATSAITTIIKNATVNPDMASLLLHYDFIVILSIGLSNLDWQYHIFRVSAH